MRKNPRLIGDEHVLSVHKGLLKYINNEPIGNFPNSVIKTVYYITNLYPNIDYVESKFETENSNQSNDLKLYLDKEIININLFLIKKGGKIQPKNPGAKSFFLKYFLSEDLQNMFNEFFEEEYINFLKDLVYLKLRENYINNKRELKKIVIKYFPKFTSGINQYRDIFLYRLREKCFELLKDSYNQKSNGFFHAYNNIFMTKDVNIVTSYGKNQNDILVDQFNPGIPKFNDIQIYKVRKNTVGIRFGEIALTLRFKFESNPTSSIKLAASYERFPGATEKEYVNNCTLEKMLSLFRNHEYLSSTNSSNAIGKCHEAITYYYFLKEFPNVSQVHQDECVSLMSKYYSQVKPEVLKKLHDSTLTVIPVIMEKLKSRYETFIVDSIELIPESYVKDRLDTGDLQLIIITNTDYVIEKISLKALSRSNSKITTKNPGIGTILGPTYFDIGSMESVVKEVKRKFEYGEYSHKDSLENLAAVIGSKLECASQQQLKKGIENLFGKAMMAVTFYEGNISYCREYSSIDSEISVYSLTPTTIQNTLTWNNGADKLHLRVKFSRGQKYGWSTIKLTSEYSLN